ncbi:D-alanyl-D-alanine carboxypeptidase [Tissierella pigra]|uniref:serine-type D-Ala-D-Ala carboxypeptidase n=1 Tax=Tissierella pigra TaxID=2607614 RepID=A0A6N7XYR8_9FIRM|nr:D-alanyl-D-alanine carboxypeptidase family protein [Tissierella pigra]MBU5428311.1 D-alanyl-D-alanine carboxypeptidase [Tissierella pigra]MSU01635.1 D-alanyl-D-alanine carboxypeptidase [Tissierella pigra]
MKRLLSILLIFMIVITGTISYGDSINTYIPVVLRENLRTYILADFETGEILEEHNINEVVEIASISKLMSYLVVMEQVSKGNVSLDDIITIDKDTTKIKGSSFKLKVGEVFTVKELLEAAIVISGNDAAYALSKYVGGTEENFVKMMNEKAKEIGIESAVFYNSTGLPIPEKDVQNKMTTKEIFLLSQYIIKKYPEILNICSIKSIEQIDRNYFELNTNPLLNEIKGVDGLKTGFTNKAGYSYVSTFTIEGKAGESKDQRLIAIVMGAKDLEKRNIMAKILVQYGIDNYSHKVFLDKTIPLKTLDFPKGHITKVDVFPEKEFSRLIKNDEDITVNLHINENMKLPIKSGAVIGRAEVLENGEIIFETNVLIKEDVIKAKWYIVLMRYIERLFGRGDN